MAFSVEERKKIIKGVTTGNLSLEAFQRKDFIRRTPPYTWVWQDKSKKLYGITSDNEGVYKDPKKDFVVVNNVNKRGVDLPWKINHIVNMTIDEIRWKNLDL